MVNCSPNFKKFKSEIIKILSSAEFELEGAHSIDTLKWVKKIDINASELLQIAALAHDIDRGISPRVTREENETYNDYKARHAERSAQLVDDLMTKYSYSKDLIKKTVLLIKKHEVGGNRETNILKDADSISFFSCNIEWYYNYKNRDLEETKREILYKYKRATPRAKKMIRTIKIKNKVLRDICKDIFK